MPPPPDFALSLPSGMVTPVCPGCRARPPRLAAGPAVLVACVTNRCNLRCPSCNYWRQKPAPEPELSLQEHEALARDVSACGLKRVVLTGGEPTLRDDWMRLVEAWAAKVPEVLLLTNGTTLDEAAVEFLAGEKNVRVIISWDGWDEALSGRFTGMPAVRQRVWGNIRRAGSHPALGKRLGANITLTPQNMRQLPAIASSLADAGVSFFHFHLVYSSRRESRFSREQALELGGLTGEAARALGARGVFDVIDHVPFAFVRLSRCFIPFSHSTVGPRGEVYGCIPAKGGFKDVASNALGSIRERPFRALWRSPEYKAFRQGAVEGRHGSCLACLACHAARHFSAEPCRSCRDLPEVTFGVPEFY